MRRTTARLLIIVAALFLIAGAAAVALVGRGRADAVGPRPEGQRPPLMLLTTLPLIFSEGFTLHEGGSKALTAMETRYRVIPIATYHVFEVAFMPFVPVEMIVKLRFFFLPDVERFIHHDEAHPISKL